MSKKFLAFFMIAAITIISVLSPVDTMADRIEDKPYLALGADLTEEQRATVLALLDVDASELDNYTISEVTNAEEHQYLGSYLDASVIGTRALSSVKVVGREDGYGIQVVTTNISYCTEGMYQNALATAGMSNADVVVVGPFPISGTAALVGAMKAYSVMTGDIIEPELMDGATNELVVTGELAESLGDPEIAVNFIAALKEIIAANEITSEEEIMEVIDSLAEDMDIELSESDKEMVTDLMDKLGDLDLDVDMLKEQAQELYDQIKDIDLSEYGITEENVGGILSQIGDFFVKIFEWIVDFFKGLF